MTFKWLVLALVFLTSTLPINALANNSLTNNALTSNLSSSEQPFITQQVNAVFKDRQFQQIAKSANWQTIANNNQFAASAQFIQKINYHNGWKKQGSQLEWALQINAEHAKSINLNLTSVPQDPLFKVYFSDPSKTQSYGPLKPDANGNIWTPVINGNVAVLSITKPHNIKATNDLKIAKVNLGFRDFNSLNNQQGCTLDTVCDEASEIQSQARSVARYTVLGQTVCTGTLVNNTNLDRTPYFLTAQHCNLTVSTAPSTVFYWGYQASICNGDRDGSLEQVSFGATLRAKDNATDLALLELYEVPPSEFTPFWSGWDNSRSAVSQSYSIHHPQGLEKSVAFNFDPLTITNGYSHLEDANANFWRVNNWNLGSTTSGSSGAGLWNSNNQLIGILTGGDATCDNPLAPDWYAQLAAQWSLNSWKHAQLKNWLAPDNSDVNHITGIDTCEVEVGSIVLEPSSPAINELINFTYQNDNTEQQTTEIQWDFNNDGNYDATGESVSFSYEFLYQGKLRVKVSHAETCSLIFTQNININNNGVEQFPLDRRLSSAWNQVRTSTKGWSLDSSSSYEGQQSLKANRINDNETAGIEYIHNFSAEDNNFIAFAVATSTEIGDRLNFYLDNQLIDQWEGENSWQYYYYPLERGVHVLKWEYQKDDNGKAGSDTVWIDAVSGFEQSRSGSGGGSVGIILLLGVFFFCRNKPQI